MASESIAENPPSKLFFMTKMMNILAKVQILFDENASRFMEFECLAFLEGCLVRAMI